MDQLGFNLGNSGILESTQEYSGITRGSYGNDLGMTQKYLGDSGRVRDMTSVECVMLLAELCVLSTLYTGIGFHKGISGTLCVSAHVLSIKIVLAPKSRSASV